MQSVYFRLLRVPGSHQPAGSPKRYLHYLYSSSPFVSTLDKLQQLMLQPILRGVYFTLVKKNNNVSEKLPAFFLEIIFLVSQHAACLRRSLMCVSPTAADLFSSRLPAWKSSSLASSSLSTSKPRRSAPFPDCRPCLSSHTSRCLA